VDGESVLAEAVEAYRVALGDRLLAAYALGSLAHGGFSELVSDIDLGLIVGDPLLPDDDARIQAVADVERSKASALHRRLSVFWGTPSTLRGEQDAGRFPALDRLDLVESGRLLAGTDEIRGGLPHPGASELLVTGAVFALEYLAGVPRTRDPSPRAAVSTRPAPADATEEIRSPDLLVSRGVRRLTKLVLFPVRFLYTAATGRVGTNEHAVASYLADGTAPGRELVEAAYGWRTVAPADTSAAASLLREHIVPLYLHYIADHAARLGELGEVELAGAFREWRERLVR
jgi:predicted nucleotidyltransferase